MSAPFSAAVRWASSASAVGYREMLSLFVTPLAYVVGTLFLLLQGYNFALLLRVLNDPLAAPGPVMQFYFGGSFFIFWLPVVFLCSVLSMRLVAEERRQGTLEALLTAPVTPGQVVVGKYLGVLSFYALLWVPTGVFYVLLRGASVQPDPGPIASGYLGTFVVGATFLAIGTLASAVSRSQLAAAIATFVTCSIALLAGLLVEQVEAPALQEFLGRTSLLSMMQDYAQGIVDTRHLWFHAGLVITLLSAATVAVDPRRRVESWVRIGLVAITVGHLAWYAADHAQRRDWTAGRVYSLSERAVSVLESLDRPVDVRVLVPSTIGGGRPNPLAQELSEVLTRMAAVTTQLRVTVVDPDRERQEAEQWIADFGLGGRDLADGVVLVRAGQGADLRKAHVTPSELVVYATGADVQTTGPRVKEFRGEEALLSAFVEVTNPVEVTVCHTQGHGEPRFDDLEPFAGYAHLGDLLDGAGLTLRAISLDSTDALAGCDILMVAGPAAPLGPQEVEVVRRYADAGGDLFLLTGAVVTPSAQRLVDHGLEPLLARYGVSTTGRIVVDPNQMPGATPMLAFTIDDGWGDHPATRALLGRPISLVFARELVLQQSETGSMPSMLVQTGPEGWAEADIAGIRAGAPLTLDEPADQPGPIVVAATSEQGGSKLVVIGSDQFALNAYFREDVAYDMGRDMVVNAIAWLSDRDVLLGLRPRPREHVKLVLMPEQLDRMTWVCLLGLPGFCLLLGGWVLWRRRR